MVSLLVLKMYKSKMPVPKLYQIPWLLHKLL